MFIDHHGVLTIRRLSDRLRQHGRRLTVTSESAAFRRLSALLADPASASGSGRPPSGMKVQ